MRIHKDFRSLVEDLVAAGGTTKEEECIEEFKHQRERIRRSWEVG
jgi:hypothetical protein